MEANQNARQQYENSDKGLDASMKIGWQAIKWHNNKCEKSLKKDEQ